MSVPGNDGFKLLRIKLIIYRGLSHAAYTTVKFASVIKKAKYRAQGNMVNGHSDGITPLGHYK